MFWAFHGNIAGHREVPELLPVLRTWRPHAAVLTEAYNVRAWAEGIDGYDLIQYRRRFGREATDIAVLVRSDVAIRRTRLMMLLRAWWGPFGGGKREPRRFTLAVLVVASVVWPLLGVHFPPGGAEGGVRTRGRNRPAWHESAGRVRRWLRRHRRALVVGDFNDDETDVREHVAIKRAKVAMASDVDGAIGVGCRVVAVDKLKAPDDMHGWMIVTAVAA
jgi:hypothetical protein